MAQRTPPGLGSFTDCGAAPNLRSGVSTRYLIVRAPCHDKCKVAPRPPASQPPPVPSRLAAASAGKPLQVELAVISTWFLRSGVRAVKMAFLAWPGSATAVAPSWREAGLRRSNVRASGGYPAGSPRLAGDGSGWVKENAGDTTGRPAKLCGARK